MGRFKDDLRPLIAGDDDDDEEDVLYTSLKSEPVIFFTNPRTLVRNRRLRSTSAVVLTMIGLGMAFLVMSVCLVVPFIKSRFSPSSNDVTPATTSPVGNLTRYVMKTECANFMHQCTPHATYQEIQYMCGCMLESEDSGTKPVPDGHHSGMMKDMTKEKMEGMMKDPKNMVCIEKCKNMIMRRPLPSPGSKDSDIDRSDHSDTPIMSHDDSDTASFHPTMPHNTSDKSMMPPDDSGRPMMPHDDNDKPMMLPNDNARPMMPHDDSDTASFHPTMPHNTSDKPMMTPDDGGRPLMPHDDNDRPMMPHNDNDKPMMLPDDNGRPMMPHDDSDRPRMPHGNTDRPMMPHDAKNRPMMPHDDSERSMMPQGDSDRPMMPHDDSGRHGPMMPHH